MIINLTVIHHHDEPICFYFRCHQELKSNPFNEKLVFLRLQGSPAGFPFPRVDDKDRIVTPYLLLLRVKWKFFGQRH
jgi:hypothetical protein